MNNTVKNIFIVAGLLAVAYAAYYLYLQREASTLDSSPTGVSNQTMISQTQMFIQHRRELDAMDPNLSIFEDPRFLSLIDYTEPVEDQPVGRSDPFAPRTYQVAN